MRARDIKRRLSRSHGYSNTELAKMIDKKELIHTLSYEEHKVYQKMEQKKKRAQMKQGIIVALICVCVVLFWPLIVQAWEVASVNFVVYTDKKKYELSRCHELSSNLGYIGILLLFFLDLLQLWLTASVLLSWFISSSNTYLYKYLFPIPRLSVRPAALLAGAMGGNAGPLGQYGINIGSMLITWMLRYTKSKVETWIGTVFSRAMKKQRKEKKRQQKQQEEWESKEDREERRRLKALRKEERKKRREEEERMAEEERKKQRERDVDEIRKRSEQSVVTNNATAAAAASNDNGGGDGTTQAGNHDEKSSNCCNQENNSDHQHEKENAEQNEFYSQGDLPSWLNGNDTNTATKDAKKEEENDKKEEGYSDDVVGSGFDELD
eukprot:CAMPEP_0185732010 /NCGR_PEP_ID=MMETSP1171-20130828/14627_1 /TAXON_ID=374046 /ORGANISM="Helicotheca tamensis, Strain CCMP826" /LENGTH=379 /DNA_ID=CAMNT_0028401393 /DNA_START=403 /DNA_END=1542 /DNA_ORIENTATION=+